MNRVIGIGDLVVDFYYKDKKLIGINGGKTSSNIIFNLATLGNNTLMFGVCGNDIFGKVCISSLNQVNVDTKFIRIDNVDTRRFHINISKTGQITKKRCPICDTKNWYKPSKLNENVIISNLDSKDIVVIDDLNKKIINILSKIKNKIMLDLGYLEIFANLTNEEIMELFSYSYEIINMNERVEKYFIEHLCIADLKTLYELLKTKLLIITRGKNGADFIFDNMIIHKDLKIIADEIDPNGAGDMFFASIINDYIHNNFTLTKDLIDNYFSNATNLTTKVVSFIGARTYKQSLYKVEKLKKDICSCKILKINI